MQLITAENHSTPASLSQAIKQELAEDGELFIPPVFFRHQATLSTQYGHFAAAQVCSAVSSTYTLTTCGQ